MIDVMLLAISGDCGRVYAGRTGSYDCFFQFFELDRFAAIGDGFVSDS